MTLAMKIDGLGKRYRRGQFINRFYYRTLRDDVGRWMSIARHWLGRQVEPSCVSDEFWALKDVDLEVEHGEVIGIIGRNGSGKSTLLKILARITKPTEGTVRLRGRVGSLLEVGTGFHPELTGRENIFLSGAVLGMRRHEIRENFDAIVDFSEIEDFLDTPVKRYSSGMYVRLAFAVAGHLQPEILLVDEVLAVGDASFQKKCLRKMGDVARTGRTVLFVSHNMGAITKLCTSVVRLKHGRVCEIGAASDVVTAYLTDGESLAHVNLMKHPDRHGSGAVRFQAVEFQDAVGRSSDAIQSGSPLCIEIHFENTAGYELKNIILTLGINDEFGTRITQLNSEASGTTISRLPPGLGKFTIKIARLPLSSGRYGVNLFCSVNGEISDWIIEDVAHFNVCDGDFFGTGKQLPAGQGKLLIDHQFQLCQRKAA